MKVNKVWFDGICKKCGSSVYETILDESDVDKDGDYKNACSNESCSENHWHYIGDDEFLDYYNHD